MARRAKKIRVAWPNVNDRTAAFAAASRGFLRIFPQ
jgi:hypothetical protein